uniref:MFS transporter n=1 Tax=Herbiconiux sp. TaxID=1871186 RepID=UPI0025B9FC2C
PAATAAAASLAPAEKRGRAIAVVAIGFTAASAFGAPLGTAIAASAGWRTPLIALAVLAALLAAAVALFVRGVPIGAVLSVRRRFAVLADPRILLTLAATLLLVCGFNVVYIYSSAVTQAATGGSGGLLAVLLLTFGLAGVLGTILSGRLTDRFGNRRVTGAVLGTQVVALAALPLAAGNLVLTGILFAVWGASANGASMPLQHRLIEIEPATAGVALSWYTTAMYAGIALAPPLGALALASGGGSAVPVAGALSVALALLAFQIGRAARSRGVALA